MSIGSKRNSNMPYLTSRNTLLTNRGSNYWTFLKIQIMSRLNLVLVQTYSKIITYGNKSISEYM